MQDVLFTMSTQLNFKNNTYRMIHVIIIYILIIYYVYIVFVIIITSKIYIKIIFY